MPGHLPILVKGLLKMATDMRHTVNKGHIGIGLEGCLVSGKTVTLKISFVFVFPGKGFYHSSSSGTIVIMEDNRLSITALIIRRYSFEALWASLLITGITVSSACI